jgi:hypothetical protein
VPNCRHGSFGTSISGSQALSLAASQVFGFASLREANGKSTALAWAALYT